DMRISMRRSMRRIKVVLKNDLLEENPEAIQRGTNKHQRGITSAMHKGSIGGTKSQNKPEIFTFKAPMYSGTKNVAQRIFS
uniref:Ig-like domain-containing protein n=1 Tax=Parascaris univalens TaxID=6257 RepID=A0A915BZI7_PARUN